LYQISIFQIWLEPDFAGFKGAQVRPEPDLGRTYFGITEQYNWRN